MSPMPTRKRHGTTRWTHEEWRQVAAAALPAVLGGTEPGLALFEGQRLVLPKARWHKRAIIHAICKRTGSQAQISLEAVRDMSEGDRARVFNSSAVQLKRIDDGEAGAPPPPAAEEMRPNSRQWNAKEWAWIARRVDYLKASGSKWAPSRLVLEAQKIELPPERNRARSGIYTGVTNGTLAKGLENGRAHLWLLTDKLDPNRTEWAPPVAEAPAAPAAPAAPPAQEARQEAQEAPEAPVVAPAVPQPLLAASSAFGDVLAQQLDFVLRAQRDQILVELLPRVTAMGAEIAAMIERGLRSTVQQIVSHELGGAQLPPEKPDKVKVDVFAFPARINVNEVKAVINGHAELRFFNPHDTERYIPPEGAHVIFTTDNIPRAARNSIEAAGIKPKYVQNSPTKVIAAIREIVGVSAPH